MVKNKYERYLLNGGGVNKYRYVYSLRIMDQYSSANQIPTLIAYESRMTIDILFISAMSAEVERVFSDAKITIDDKRQCLKASTIKTVKCLNSWFQLSHLPYSFLTTKQADSVRRSSRTGWQSLRHSQRCRGIDPTSDGQAFKAAQTYDHRCSVISLSIAIPLLFFFHMRMLLFGPLQRQRAK